MIGRVIWLTEESVIPDSCVIADELSESEALDAGTEEFEFVAESRLINSRLAITLLLRLMNGGGPTLARN